MCYMLGLLVSLTFSIAQLVKMFRYLYCLGFAISFLTVAHIDNTFVIFEAEQWKSAITDKKN